MQPDASPQGLIECMPTAGHLFENHAPEGSEGKAEQCSPPATAFSLINGPAAYV
jgi:hypothetical protein